jgi:DnaJ-class molecular chaperone
MTLYEVLGLTAEASVADIKAAHRQAVKTHHPDVGGDARKFEQVQRAYFTLSDPDRRMRYDTTGIEGDPAAATEAQLAHSAIATLIVQFIGGNPQYAFTAKNAA